MTVINHRNTVSSARPLMLIRQCLHQKPPPTFMNTCCSCRRYASHSINPSPLSQSDEAATSRPVIPSTWPTRRPPAQSSADSPTVPEHASASPLQEIVSILTTKSATKRNEAMAISAFTPTTAKHFYPQGPDFKPPIGAPWDPDSKAWRRYVAIPRLQKSHVTRLSPRHYRRFRGFKK